MPSTHPTLSADQIAEIRDDLLCRLGKLERNLKTNGTRPVELDQSCVGRLSRIEALQNQGLTRNLQEREQIQLSQILEALRRIEEGDYGICTTCHEPIRFERLQIFPETPTCAPCGSGG